MSTTVSTQTTQPGWYSDGRLGIVWRAEITRFDFTFGQARG